MTPFMDCYYSGKNNHRELIDEINSQPSRDNAGERGKACVEIRRQIEILDNAKNYYLGRGKKREIIGGSKYYKRK